VPNVGSEGWRGLRMVRESFWMSGKDDLIEVLHGTA